MKRVLHLQKELPPVILLEVLPGVFQRVLGETEIATTSLFYTHTWTWRSSQRRGNGLLLPQ
jgi:hypothetical protein